MTNVEVPEYEVQEELTTRPGQSVLLVVDMQKDFMHPDGALAAPNPVEAIQALTEFDRHAALRQASRLFGADLVRADGLHLR